jgi:hypothetical protein
MKLRIITEEKRGRYYVKPQKLVDEKWEDLKEGTKSVAAARLHGNEIRSLSSTKIAGNARSQRARGRSAQKVNDEMHRLWQTSEAD